MSHTTLIFETAGSQINGRRDYQEDAFLITHLGDPRRADSACLVIVADGMGGHAAGNVASNMAVQSFNKHLTGQYANEDLGQALKASVAQANQAIAVTVKETPALTGMGCTLVAAFFSNSGLRWLSVGDSHLYLLRDGQLWKKNADHSYGGFLDRMAATAQTVEPEAGYTRNMLLSALTGDEIAEIDCPDTALQLRPGDRIILSTDGLDTLSSDEVVACSVQSATAADCVDTLLQRVAGARVPRQDNATVVVIDVAAKQNDVPAHASAAQEAAATVAELRATPSVPRTPDAMIAVNTVTGRRAKQHYVLGIVAAVGMLAALGSLLWTGTLDRQPTLDPVKAVPNEPEAPAPVGDRTPARQSDVPTPASTPDTIGNQDRPAPSDFRDPLRIGGHGPELLWISPGTFQMGNARPGADYNEQPQHRVEIGKFAIGRFELTVGDYQAFLRATDRRSPDLASTDEATRPVVMVSWDDAVRYTRWLSEQTGHHYRLPSEAEWEYAAAAQATTPFWWGFQIGENNAICYGCGTAEAPREPARVGSLKPNSFGLFDTAGNVMEWVQDCYHGSYRGAPADGSSWEDGDCAMRVARGGAFSSPAKSLRTTKRARFRPDRGYDDIGIRIVREP